MTTPTAAPDQPGTLTDLLSATADADELYGAFVDWCTGRGLTLYPAQDDAVIEVFSGSNLILATPTGSGKSLVAVAAHFAAMAAKRRSFYTAPIKALVSEKFFALCEVFGSENVGMVTGDASINADAPIVCATAEIVANLALRGGDRADIGQVVMDEFHFYSDPDRGWAWQVPLLELPQAQFVLMSATLGDVDFFREDITRRTGRPTALVTGTERPVPLMFSYATTPITETIEELISTHQAPVYVVHFTQASALERAQALTSLPLTSREEKEAIAELIGGFRFTKGFGTTLSRLVRKGIGVHHAGMLPRYRRLVERLAQAGLLKVICGTDTLGVGINVPIRTVLFTGLAKYDGVKVRHPRAREFHQIAGRAGRPGFDTVGYVVVQAPEYEIENARRVAKAGDDPKKLKKVQRTKAPVGEVSWQQATFDRLVNAQPEQLISRLKVSNSMLLNLLGRPGDASAALTRLLSDNHERDEANERHRQRADELLEGLINGDVVRRLDTPDDQGRTMALTVDLQRDFALNQPLSPFALAAVGLLDRESETYALDVVSVVESTLEDPRQILSAQQFRARGEAVAQMKADGIEYDERMELLEEITWPKPLAELLLPAYQTYLGGHPWLAEYELSPKSVVREMAEQAMTFTEYVSSYGLARSEGAVLRYLTDAYRALRQTVPSEARTDELTDLIEWLGELVRQVDSSLLDEWEQLTNGVVPRAEVALESGPRPITTNTRAFRVLVRNAMFRRVSLASRRDWSALAELDPDVDWAESLAPYFEEHGYLPAGADARGPQFFEVTEGPDEWTVRQVIADPEKYYDWAVHATVDLAASDEAGEAVVTVTSVAQQ